MTDEAVLKLDDPTFPICNRVISTNPGWELEEATDPTVAKVLIWELEKPHPIIDGMRVVRMYSLPGVSVDVYSFKAEGKDNCGVRNTIPWHHVRIVEEIMDVPTFVEEIGLAEEDEEGAPPRRKLSQPNGAPQPQPA